MNVLLPYKPMRQLLVGLVGLSSLTCVADVVRDPTMPLLNLKGGGLVGSAVEKEEKKATSLILQSVIVQNGRKIAVINNQLVLVGQKIEGYKVTGIVPYGAELQGEGERDGEKLSLTLYKANIKISNE
ncbi:MAG: hypothetical protein MJK04_27840 [Psychrosphaera sp.]|nr:hypothetical protein [Psychrosphaera sp.]